MKLFMEAFFDNIFGVILNVITLTRASQIGNFGDFFGSRDNILCSSITIVYCIALVIFPFWMYLTIKKNFKTLRFKGTQERYGFLYEGVKTENAIHAYYNVLFIIRRLLTALVLIFMLEYPFF